MARNWLFPKKRGAHRTASSVWGRVWEASFFLGLFLLGVAGVISLGWSLLARTWPVNSYFPALYFQTAEAVVRGTQIETVPAGDETEFQPQLLIEFPVQQQTQASWVPLGQPVPTRDAAQQRLTEYTVGDQLICWYDPLEPEHTTIEHSTSWGLWLTVGLLVALAIAGAYGVITTALQVGASAERRAALSQAAASRMRESSEPLPASGDFPTVPRDANLLNSPGVKLKYRLPATQEPAWRLFGSAVWMLTCGALAAALTVVAVEQMLSGNSFWLLACFTLVVLALACWAIYHFLNELVSASWMGPTSIEISEMPLRPGGTYDVYLFQAGNLHVGKLSVLLVCEEETTFLQGTDIRHDHQRVYCREICRREQFAIDVTEPVEEHCPLTIPAEAMHSCQTRYNAVQWKLIVTVEADNWPPYQRTFPLIVYPSPSTLAQQDREEAPVLRK